MKAGLMEIADFIVMNKSDRPGSKQAITSLQTILMMRDHDEKSWMMNIISSIASENKGIDEIVKEIERHQKHIITNDLLIKGRERRMKKRIKEIVENKIKEEIWTNESENYLNSSLEKVVLGNLSPYHIAEDIISNFKN